MPQNYRVSVVIPTCRPDNIRATLGALQAQSNRSFEVVIVENGKKTPGFEEFVKTYGETVDCRCRHLYLEEAGANQARNHGVTQTKAPIIAFTDDDCIPATTWIAEIIESYEKWPQAEIIGGRTVLDFKSAPPSWLVGPFRHWLSEVDWGNEARPLIGREYLVSANMSVRRDTFEQLGGLHTRIAREAAKRSFMPQNDELGIQNLVKSSSIDHVVYTPALLARHQIDDSRLTLDWMLKRNYGQGRSDILLAIEHGKPSASDLHQILLRAMHPDEWFGYMRLPFDHALAFDERVYERNFIRCKLAYWQGAADQISDLS